MFVVIFILEIAGLWRMRLLLWNDQPLALAIKSARNVRSTASVFQLAWDGQPIGSQNERPPAFTVVLFQEWPFLGACSTSFPGMTGSWRLLSFCSLE
jgi:hypothetical protein